MKANELGISPAPWQYDDNRDNWEGIMGVFDRDGRFLVGTGEMEGGEWQEMANGRLMAAAPDLYEALAALCNAVDNPRSVFDVLVKAVAAGRAALEKAKG